MMAKMEECCGGGSGLQDSGPECAPEDIQKGLSRDDFNCFAWCRGRTRRSKFPGIGIALVALGLIWLGVTIGWFHSAYIWPVAMTIFGVCLLLLDIICGIPMTVMGLLWLGETLGWLQPGYFWPLFVTIIGLWIIVPGLVKRKRRG
jgi:hypothetical protein